MMYNITSFGVINILVCGSWGSNFNRCPNMVSEVKKMPNAFFTFFNFLTTKNKISLQTTCAHGTAILNICPRTTMLCDSTPNSDCWKNICKKCIDGKIIVPSYKQWEKVEIPSHSKDTETYKKICIITKDCQVGEVVERFKKLLVELKNTRIQSLSRLQNFKEI